MKKTLSLLVLFCLVFSLCACNMRPPSTVTVSPDSVPAFSEDAFVAINDNVPYFEEKEYTTSSFEYYSRLDFLGRCRYAYACVGQDLMPTEDRESISSVKPSGWQSASYDFILGKSLYNRCHLIGFQLTGENANERNLITGTRYLNVEGMLPFENMIADYVKETGNHVLYRVTPIFNGNDLVAMGVLMEGYSVEDNGAGICFNVYAYNEQPGVVIDHATGDNKAAELSADDGEVQSFVINTNSKKFHLSTCPNVSDIKPGNRQSCESTFGNLKAQGYKPCGKCLG